MSIDKHSANEKEPHKIYGSVWYRESTDEWVLELSGTIFDTHFTCRHTQPPKLTAEDVAGLPATYDRIEQLEAAIERIKTAAQPLLAFDISPCFDAKGTYSKRKSEELHRLQMAFKQALQRDQQ